MKNILCYANNLVANVARSIRYIGNYKAPLISSFDRLRISIARGGKMKIGNYCQCRGGVYFVCDGGSLVIGEHCFFNVGCSVTCIESVTIGNGCTFGNNVVIVDHDHDFRNENRGCFVASPVSIGKNVWIGANTVILRGTKIGDNCVIGAGSVVKGDIPANSIVVQKQLQRICSI